MVTVPLLAGVKIPEDVIVPLFVDQLTAELKFPVPLTVAEHVDDVPLPSTRDGGVHVTTTEVIVGGGVIVNITESDFVESCIEVALIVSDPELGIVAGAV